MPQICIHTLFLLGAGSQICIPTLFCNGPRPQICIPTLFVLGAGSQISIPTLFVLGAGPQIRIHTLFVLSVNRVSVNRGGPLKNTAMCLLFNSLRQYISKTSISCILLVQILEIKRS